jgi:hypothetical protein
MRKSIAVGSAALVAAGGLLAATPANAADATVSVLNGIPADALGGAAATVDVYANGNKIIDDFTPGKLETLTVPGGSYDLVVAAGDSTDASTPILEASGVEVPAGANATVTANLNEAGDAGALSVFVNDTATIAAGEGRVTVRHIAAAPEVTVSADGNALGNISNASGSQELKADVAAKTYAVAVAPASGGDAVFSTDLPVTEGTNTIVYAWGSLADGSFAVATQAIDGLGSAPTGVPAGEVGLAADGEAFAPNWVLAAMLAAGIGLLVSTQRFLARDEN